MKEFYNFTLNGYDIPHQYSLADKADYLRDLCGGMVWDEIETTFQELPKYARYVDTFWNINVYYDRVSDVYLFVEYN